jgi:hypothetical protein
MLKALYKTLMADLKYLFQNQVITYKFHRYNKSVKKTTTSNKK